jgi:predicted RND superfamily exporter protein
VSIVYSGVIPVVYKAQRELLNSLIESTAWSFSTITPLMMYVCGGIAAGLVVIIPNALPVLVVFGGMGWLGIRIDIGSMMAASIALGVAVDDTIHFLAWFKDDFRALGDRKAAILSAYRRSATATLQAALINGLGLSVFATSSFTPTQRFGWLMLVILIAGMVAELVMLPSILFGPIGRVFDAKHKRPAHAPNPAAGPPADSSLRVDNGTPVHERSHATHESQAHSKL